ncbi:MAG: D-3-phosphoglycerate dehydrogenase / 2-oxoglutarate reductase [Actinomycetota bacterium]|jgi:D-3-phosphoglycerate dehydrogenase
MARVLITEELAPSANAALAAAGHDVDVRLGLSPDELCEAVKGAHALIVRSATKVTADVFEAADALIVVGRAGVGIDNIDLAAATKRGVMVANAPFSIGVSTAEFAMALLLSLARNVPQSHSALVEGRWEKSKWEGIELHGKVLGLLGIGRIGSLVAQRANAFGMRILAWDPWMSSERAQQMGVEMVGLDELIAAADFISIHLLKTEESVGLVNAELMAKMKPTVRIVNGARGGIVNEADLAAAIKAGQVGGAALDVFADEPTTESPLFGLPSVVVTPHLGASTAEAQDKAGVQVAEQVVLALAGEFVPNAMNVNAAAASETVRPFVALAERLGGLLAGLLGDVAPTLLEVEYRGPLADNDVSLATLSATRGVLDALVDEAVSFVNAPNVAAARSLDVKELKIGATEHESVLTLRCADRSVAGTLSGLHREARIVAIDGISCEVPPAKHLLVVRNDDRVGMLALVTAAMRDADINVSNMHLGRSSDGSAALMVLATDAAVPAEVVEALRANAGILDARSVSA